MAPQCFDIASNDLLEILALRLAKEGLGTADIPSAEDPELLHLLTELGFDSALQRAKLRKALRGRRGSDVDKFAMGPPIRKTVTEPARVSTLYTDDDDERATEPGCPCDSAQSSASELGASDLGNLSGGSMGRLEKSLPLGCSASTVAGGVAVFRSYSMSVPSRAYAGSAAVRTCSSDPRVPRAGLEAQPRQTAPSSSSTADDESIATYFRESESVGSKELSPNRGRLPQSLAGSGKVPPLQLRAIGVAPPSTACLSPRLVKQGCAPPPQVFQVSPAGVVVFRAKRQPGAAPPAAAAQYRKYMV